MSANNDNGIVIPAVFVGEHTGRMINEDYQWNEDFALLINNESPFNINTHLLLPFTVVVGLCFITMIIFTVVRCCRERRRLMRHRLPKSVLKKIPTIKFLRGVHQYDTCAICLEDYVDGEKLRVLHCSHGKFDCQSRDKFFKVLLHFQRIIANASTLGSRKIDEYVRCVNVKFLFEERNDLDALQVITVLRQMWTIPHHY